MSDNKLTRRMFLERAAASAVGLSAAGFLVASCKNETTAAATGGAGGGGEGIAGADFSCTDVSGLTESEKKTREQLQYVDDSPHPNKTCDNCQLYTAPEPGDNCGGCTVLAGPVHPKGYCNSWVQKAG